MTCIVGAADGGRVWIGGDSAAVTGSHLRPQADPKVFEVGGALVGCCGSIRSKHLVHYAFVPPMHPEDLDDHAFIATRWVDALRVCLRAGGALKTIDGVESSDDFGLLVGYRGRLYVIETDFQVRRPLEAFTAIGVGATYALGAMLTCSVAEAPMGRLTMGLAAATYFCTDVCQPFHILAMPAEQR